MAKNKKTDKRNSLIALILLLILLITATYAWFTSNQTVTVNELQVNVQARNGLQISSDAQNWKSVLTNEDLADAKVGAVYGTHVNQIPTEMEPVSTAGNVTAGKLDMFYGQAEPDEVTGNFTLTSEKQTDTRGTVGRYIAFDLFLQVNQETEIGLTDQSSVVSIGQSKGLENAARVALLNQGNVAPGSAPSSAHALNGATNSEVYLWEPNYDVHTPGGVANALSTYGLTTTETGASALPYNGIKTAFDETAGVTITNTGEQPTYFDPVTPDLRTTKEFTGDQPYLTLQPGVTKIRVYMWVEGEDVDCENNASGVDIGYNLQFAVQNAMTP